MEIQDKRKLYKTAQATISCALFKAGDFVTVEYQNHCACGAAWYKVTNVKGESCCYPEHHLTRFCF